MYCVTQAQDRIITGKVIDAQTKLPLVSCSIYSLNSSNGVITDENGKFVFSISDKTDSVGISMIGYKSLSKSVTKALNQVINFEAIPLSSSMEAVVVAIKSKYTKAQRLVKKVIEHKSQNNVYDNKTYQCQVYDKIEVDLKDIPPKIQNNRFLKPLAFAFNNMDSTPDKQKLLPIYLSETNANFYYRKNPEKEVYDYTALKSSGIDNKSILTYADGLYKKINIYSNNIKLVDINFVSPIADNALNYYEYHIVDTLFFDNHRCIQVQFVPLNYATNTFNGYMWITDTSYAIKSVVMHMDKNANINFVKKFEISQFFRDDGHNKFFPEKNILYVDLALPEMKKTSAIVKKTTLYNDAIINNNSIDTAFNKKHIQLSSPSVDTTGVALKRFEPLSKSENSVYVLMDTLNKIPIIVLYEKIFTAITVGYYKTGKVDIGNIYGFYTNNIVEGNRYTFGARTNSSFNRNIQLKGYGGYSTLDEKFRYLLSSIFVLSRNQWSTLKLTYSNDIAGSYDHSDELDQNSIFASLLTRVPNSQIKLLNSENEDVAYQKYFDNGIGIGGEIKHNTQTPFFDVYYTYGKFAPYIVNEVGGNGDYTTNEATVSLRYSHEEKYITQHYRRGSLGSIYPIFTLSYTKGIKVNDGLLKSDFNYSKWNLNIEHDFTDGRIGYLSYTIDAGIVNGVLPIVLLDLPKGNDTYYYNNYAFNDMNRYEFATDRYASLSVQQEFGNFPFRYIPLLKRTKWRSLVTFKGVIGGMSEANKIANGYYDTTATYHFTVPDKTPYLETGVGIENILHLLRVDAVWRLNYLNNPGISKFGIKLSMQLIF